MKLKTMTTTEGERKLSYVKENNNFTNYTNYGNKDDVNFYLAFTFEVVLMIIAGIIGIVGNVATLCMFCCNKGSRNTFSKFHKLMIMLAIYDSVYIMLSILLFAIPVISEEYKLNGLHFYIAPKAIPFIQIALTGSVYSTIAILVERYLKVCKPFYAFTQNWSARHYVIPITIFSLIYNLPKFFEIQSSS